MSTLFLRAACVLAIALLPSGAASAAGVPEPVSCPPGADACYVSPDGNWAAWPGAGAMHLVGRDVARPLTPEFRGMRFAALAWSPDSSRFVYELVKPWGATSCTRSIPPQCASGHLLYMVPVSTNTDTSFCYLSRTTSGYGDSKGEVLHGWLDARTLVLRNILRRGDSGPESCAKAFGVGVEVNGLPAGKAAKASTVKRPPPPGP